MIESDVDCVSENEEREKFVMTISKNLITNTVEGVATDEAGNKKVVAQSAG